MQYTSKCSPVSILIASRQNNDCEKILDILSSQNDYKVTGIEKDETGAIIKTGLLNPDILILDIQPSQIDSDKLIPIIHRGSPSTAILMLCDNSEENNAARVIRAGASGILLKEKDMDKLVPAIEIVSLGGYHISASIVIAHFKTDTYANNFSKHITEENNITFSQAEQCIITDLAKGYSDKEISIRLNYSEGTIKNSIAAIKRRTKLKNRIQIVVYALSIGIIRMEDAAAWEDLDNK
ncbi:MAG: response regulator transcription factor [Treponema sp.]|nr:response regulator transcription factor [Treponema sp.]